VKHYGKQMFGIKAEAENAKQVVRIGGRCNWPRGMFVVFCISGVELSCFGYHLAQFVMLC
jgi:hypothetical protein